MFNLRRYFSLMSAGAIVAVTVTLVVVYQRHSMDQLIESAESENVTLARAFANTIWPHFSSYVMSISAADGSALRARSETQEIHDVLMTLTSGLPVLKVKIYNLDGLTVYSSQPSQIGADKSNNLGYLASARDGSPASKLSHRDTFNAFSGTVLDRDLVESYIPIWGPDGAIEGVFELYTDVTPLVARIKRTTITLTIGLLLILGLLYGALFLIVQHADRILKKQYLGLLRSEESIKARNTALEIEVTERKRAQESLQRAEFALDHASDAAIWLDRDGRVVFANGASCRMLGYSRDELLGSSVTDYDPDASLDDFALAFERIKAHGPSRFKARHRTKGGEYIPVEVSIHYMWFGNAELMCSYSRDITERTRAEAALREAHDSLEQRVRERTAELQGAQQQLSSIMNSVVDAVITFDADGFIQSFNRAAERIFGYSMIKVPNMNVRNLISEATASDHDGYLTNLPNGGEIKSGGLRQEVTGRRKDGATFPLEVSISRMDSTGPPMFVTICRDLTERKRAEENQEILEQQLVQAQKMEAIGQLTGGIAHDFNNLLMVIDGYAHRAARNPDDTAATAGALHEVLKATEKAAKLTSQLLSFSRRRVMEKRVFRIEDNLLGIKELLGRSVGELYDLRFAIDDAGACVETDPGEFAQAILNLAVNARDAMGKGGNIVVGTRVVELDAAFTQTHQNMSPGRFVEVYVEDHGHGIDPETLKRIFEPFFTTKDQGKGTGLGLTMVYGFAQQSGGCVEVRSVPNEGTLFQVYLPVVDRKPAEIAAEVEEIHHGKGETILLVEDDEAVLALTRDLLEDLGYTVLTAGTGLEALEIDEEHDGHIDLLLSDVVMPALGGFEVAEMIRERRPDTRIVFMSGYPNRNNTGGKMPAGAQFLQKPVKANRLARVIRMVLDSTDLGLVG